MKSSDKLPKSTRKNASRAERLIFGSKRRPSGGVRRGLNRCEDVQKCCGLRLRVERLLGLNYEIKTDKARRGS